MTSTAVLEGGVGGPAGTTEDRLHRGRRVVLAFLMQGWGQVSSLILAGFLQHITAARRLIIGNDGPDL